MSETNTSNPCIDCADPKECASYRASRASEGTSSGDTHACMGWGKTPCKGCAPRTNEGTCGCDLTKGWDSVICAQHRPMFEAALRKANCPAPRTQEALRDEIEGVIERWSAGDNPDNLASVLDELRTALEPYSAPRTDHVTCEEVVAYLRWRGHDAAARSVEGRYGLTPSRVDHVPSGKSRSVLRREAAQRGEPPPDLTGHLLLASGICLTADEVQEVLDARRTDQAKSGE